MCLVKIYANSLLVKYEWCLLLEYFKMALPRIQESDPWLEVDEDEIDSRLLAEKKAKSKLESERNPESPSMTGTITTVAKISIYSYLIFQILSKSALAMMFFKYLRSVAGKYQSITSIACILVITLLGHRSHN